MTFYVFRTFYRFEEYKRVKEYIKLVVMTSLACHTYWQCLWRVFKLPNCKTPVVNEGMDSGAAPKTAPGAAPPLHRPSFGSKRYLIFREWIYLLNRDNEWLRWFGASATEYSATVLVPLSILSITIFLIWLALVHHWLIPITTYNSVEYVEIINYSNVMMHRPNWIARKH